ncbi:MAG: hypothetical protein IIX30_05250, partial [Clostridia bacterium]|nr:hypothetical protein [Clostridia bacterium]
MKAKRTLIKSIALILVLFTVFTTLLSCAADNGLGGESSGSGSESENESSNTPDVEYDIGEDGEDGEDGEASATGITVFANGQYLASVIRS